MEEKVEASEVPGEEGGKDRVTNTEPLLQHLLMYLLLLQEGNAPCGKELLQKVLCHPISLLGGLLCLTVQQQQAHQEKYNHGAGRRRVL